MSPWLPPPLLTMGCTHLPPPEPTAPYKMDAHPPGCPQIVAALLSGCPSHIWITPPRGGHLYALPPSHVPTHLDASHTWLPPNPGYRLFLDAPHIWMPPIYVPLQPGCPTHTFLDDTWVPRTPGCPPVPVPQSQFPSPGSQSWLPIPVPNPGSPIPVPNPGSPVLVSSPGFQSRFPIPGSSPLVGCSPRPTRYPIMPRFPQGTPGAVVRSRPAVRWPCPLSAEGRVGAGRS